MVLGWFCAIRGITGIHMNSHGLAVLGSVLALAFLCGCEERKYANGFVEPRYGLDVPNSVTHLEFSFRRIQSDGPASGVKNSPWVLNVPGEYVDLPRVKWQGAELLSLPLRVQFPGPTPWKAWTDAERETKLRDAGLPVGRYTVDVGGGGALGAWDARYRHNMLPSRIERTLTYWMRKGDALGMEMYHEVDCLSDEKFAQLGKAGLPDRLNTDEAPENCRTITGELLLVGNTSDYGFVVANCVGSINMCWLRFHALEGEGMTMVIHRKDLEHWKLFVGAVRGLVASFVVS